MTASPKKPPDGESILVNLLERATPILDVRAPVEFAQGCIPHSVNLPIMSDAEREQVGTAYKQLGHDAAVRLGHELVSGQIKQQRIDGWRAFFDEHPHAYLTCWRGGERSRTALAWLQQTGASPPVIPGGYKALRNVCLQVLADAADEKTLLGRKPWWVIAGRTGTQKTVAINQLTCSIDLEGLAHHRGSAFGGHGRSGQPTPATFENALACEVLTLRSDCLVLEDESRTIGRLALPEAWHARMQRSPLVLIEASLESRVAHIASEYVTEPIHAGEDPRQLSQQYRDALARIRKRLGGLRYQRIEQAITDAFAGKIEHDVWIEALLSEYYDPMYDYQLKRKQSRIVMRGTRDEVESFLVNA